MDKLLLDLAHEGPLVLVLVLVLWSGSKGVWKWGSDYRDLLRDRDYWRDLAVAGTGLAENAVGLAERRKRRYSDGPSE